ncbi:MAG: hypothetical protein ACE5I9_00955 [Candidatus Methylomirabilales bacterium]
MIEIEEVMVRRHLCGVFGGSLAVLGLGTLVIAASLDLHKARETTKKLIRENASALIGVTSALPDELRIEVIEIIQGLQLSRDRIILFLDRVEKGVFPPEEGAERVRAIAKAAAQKEKEFLQALMKRVPAPAVPKVEKALVVSAKSWEGVLSAFRLSQKEQKSDLPPHPPGFDILLIPPGFPVSPPPSE